ncbi:MAG: RNA polymerase sigma factor [Candidatus Dormibacteraeota bacterium]|uniref:RNA polymerase sigma factor n=1 Tax=Candidatus Amunia macphersoniae TaxID=3127014 RepID=A0A934KSJ1_9BACT|nr:RNA polymerase sigma factor [Candidatus Dormibacteraeota bacterium]
MAATARPQVAEASFDALLGAERRRLYGIAYSILRDHSDAEDALQDAMLKAWRSWDSVRDESARQTWMVRICVNHCINRRQGLRLRLARVTHSGDAAPPDPRFEGRLVDLDRSYRKLSPRQRAAVFLHYHHGYSIDECADLMSCRPGSVRTHLARALASMRKEMANG